MFAEGDQRGMESVISYSARDNDATYASKPKLVALETKTVLEEYLNGTAYLLKNREVVGDSSFDLSFYTKNLDLADIQRQLEIAGTLAIRPVVSDGEIWFECFSEEQLVPEVNERTKKLESLGVLYKKGGEDVLEVWDRESFAIAKGSKVIEEGENPYGQIPFIIFRANKRSDSWFGKSDLASIVENNNQLNKLLTELLQLMHDYSYSIFVLEGFNQESPNAEGEEPNAMLRDLSYEGGILTVPPGSTLKAVSPSANIDSVVNAIDAIRQKIRRDAFIPEIADSEYSSGFALRQREKHYLRFMEVKRKMLGKADSELVALAILIWEVFQTGTPRQLNKDFKVITLFDDKKLKDAPEQEKMLMEQHLLSTNAITAIDIIMYREGVTRDEAQNIWERNKSFNQGEEPLTEDE